MKINDRIVGGITALVLAGGITAGGVMFATVASSTPEPAAEVVEVIDLSTIPAGVNGLADEQEAEAAAVEAARIAAEQAAAEAARVAAEQAAAAEAQRIADEAAQAESFDEPSDPEPSEPDPVVEPPAGGPDPSAQNHTICEVLADGTQVPCQ